MRITYIHQHFKAPTQAGGGRPYQFARRLASSGHEVTMICAGPSRETYQLDGFTVQQLPTKYDNRMPTHRRIAAFASFMTQALATSARIPADTVLASSTPLTVVIPGAVAAAVRRSRFVLEIRDLWPSLPIELGVLPERLHAPARALERFGYARADQVIALSPGMAAGVTSVNPEVPVEVIPNCADIDDFDIQETREEARSVLGLDGSPLLYYAGSLGRSYDIEWVVRLAAGVQAEGGRVVIAGEGAELEPGRELARSLGLDPDAVFLGPLPRRDVAMLARASDAAVSALLPLEGLKDNSLNKVFDASAAARPVVMNHEGWLSDLLVSRGAGWRVERDLSNLPTVLAALRDPNIRDRASESIAQLAAEDFSRDRLYQLFESAVTGSPRSVAPAR